MHQRAGANLSRLAFLRLLAVPLVLKHPLKLPLQRER